MSHKLMLDFSYQNIIYLQYLDSSEKNYESIKKKSENSLIKEFFLQNAKNDNKYSLWKINTEKEISFESKIKVIKEYPLTSNLIIEENNASDINKILDTIIIEKLNERLNFLMMEKSYFLPLISVNTVDNFLLSIKILEKNKEFYKIQSKDEIERLNKLITEKEQLLKKFSLQIMIAKYENNKLFNRVTIFEENNKYLMSSKIKMLLNYTIEKGKNKIIENKYNVLKSANNKLVNSKEQNAEYISKLNERINEVLNNQKDLEVEINKLKNENESFKHINNELKSKIECLNISISDDKEIKIKLLNKIKENEKSEKNNTKITLLEKKIKEQQEKLKKIEIKLEEERKNRIDEEN